MAAAPLKRATAPSPSSRGEAWPVLAPGTRVRLPGGTHVLRLRSRLGTVVGPDSQADGHYVIRLDRPARYNNGVSPPRTLREVVEAVDNLELVAPNS